MSGRPSAPRGTHDVLPPETRRREHLIDTARAVFEMYAYEAIVTPTFEETEVFVRGVGTSTDIVRKEMYSFTDQGGRELTLRPEGTASVARAFVQHGMHKLQLPVKLWYLAPMFRQEAPQKGRFREHYQLGIEVLGSDSPLVDIEVIAVLADLYERLRVPKLGLRISSMGDPDSRAAHREALIPHLERNAGRLTEEARGRITENPLRLFDSKDQSVQSVMAEAPPLGDYLSADARAHYGAVLLGLDKLAIAYETDSTLVRGMDYYTKTVFEFTCGNLGAQSAIGGGGRYDGLVEQLGGPPTPGIGFGTGVERLMLALEGVGENRPSGLRCYVAILDDDLRVELLPLIGGLRSAGISVETDLRGRGLKAMMKHAASRGAEQAVIIGRRDYDDGVATVRDMRSGDQQQVPLDQLAEVLA
ncbi:MAG: histidine--tRNA ligase [Thermoleophilia bacterium]|nr:histidine--tRNA ligase [Thermoleophilia bacterium]MDH3724588.1 histidine--tRNA ligase [Thermoleophilia bacterium]